MKNKEFAKKFAQMTADSDPGGSRHIFYASVSVFIEKDGKILLIEEEKYDVPETAIDPPSSHVTWNDGSLINSAERAVLSETGYYSKMKQLVGIYEIDVFERHYFHFVFEGELEEEEPSGQIAEDTVVEVLWVDKEKYEEVLPKMRAETLRQAFRDFVNGKRFPLEVITHMGRTH